MAKTYFTIMVEPEMLRRLKQLAETTPEITTSGHGRLAILEYLRRHENNTSGTTVKTLPADLSVTG